MWWINITYMLANPFNIVKKVFDGITLLQQQKKQSL